MSHETDREVAAKWARDLLAARDWVILDTETTGLHDAEIVQIGILSPDGRPLLDALVKPAWPIPTDATAVHGITDAMVAGAATLDDLLPAMKRILTSCRRVIVYNLAFDSAILSGCVCRRRPADADPCEWDAWLDFACWECAMLPYAAWYGERGRYGYRWQRLEGGDHSAIGDCRATLDVVRRMAESAPELRG